MTGIVSNADVNRSGRGIANAVPGVESHNRLLVAIVMNLERGVHPKAVSLPESLGACLMLLAVDEYEGQYTLWLYSLDNEYVPVDKLCLYAIEDKEDEIDPEEFVQYFSITSDYEIHLLDYSKTRQKAQSEEVYYIDDARRFALRSSKTEE